MLYKTSQLADPQEALSSSLRVAANLEILQCDTVLGNRIVIINPENKYCDLQIAYTMLVDLRVLVC